MKVSHFGTVVAIVLMLTSTPVWACYVTQECAQLQQSMEEFYNRAVENNRFTRSRSINLGRGQERYYFLEDDIAKFIKKKSDQYGSRFVPG